MCDDDDREARLNDRERELDERKEEVDEYLRNARQLVAVLVKTQVVAFWASIAPILMTLITAVSRGGILTEDQLNRILDTLKPTTEIDELDEDAPLQILQREWMAHVDATLGPALRALLPKSEPTPTTRPVLSVVKTDDEDAKK